MTFAIEHLIVVLAATAIWIVPLVGISGQVRPLRYRLTSMFALTVLVGVLCVMGFEFAVGFLVFGGGFGLLLTWGNPKRALVATAIASVLYTSVLRPRCCRCRAL